MRRSPDWLVKKKIVRTKYFVLVRNSSAMGGGVGGGGGDGGGDSGDISVGSSGGGSDGGGGVEQFIIPPTQSDRSGGSRRKGGKKGRQWGKKRTAQTTDADNAYTAWGSLKRKIKLDLSDEDLFLYFFNRLAGETECKNRDCS